MPPGSKYSAELVDLIAVKAKVPPGSKYAAKQHDCCVTNGELLNQRGVANVHLNTLQPKHLNALQPKHLNAMQNAP